jgi:hypothetical protein
MENIVLDEKIKTLRTNHRNVNNLLTIFQQIVHEKRHVFMIKDWSVFAILKVHNIQSVKSFTVVCPANLPC